MTEASSLAKALYFWMTSNPNSKETLLFKSVKRLKDIAIITEGEAVVVEAIEAVVEVVVAVEVVLTDRD